MAGDRAKLYDRLTANITDAERLEILLENAFPRADCAGIAAALLRRFPGMNAVLSCTAEELTAADGIPADMAAYLVCVGRCLQGEEEERTAYIPDSTAFERYIAARLGREESECGELLVTDNAGRIARTYRFTSDSISFVKPDFGQLFKLLVKVRSGKAYLGHNHINLPPLPSAADDRFTLAVKELAEKCGVKFADHIIVNNLGETFSYAKSGRLAALARNPDAP